MRGKHIIVAVSAGIAEYKAIEVVSRLRKKGAEVKVVSRASSGLIVSVKGATFAIDTSMARRIATR